MSAKINEVDKIKHYLEFGMRLSVTIKFGPKDEYNLQCGLIGLKENQFLLLDMSQKSVEDLITRRTNNVSVIVRGITDTDLGHIIAFKSKIITITSRPTWLMFIRLPYHFESKPIRSSKRFKLNTPIAVTYGEVTEKGILRDLSASGCGIFFKKPLEIDKQQAVVIKPELKHFPESVPECEVVNVRKTSTSTFVGIKFSTDISIEDQLKFEVLELSLVMD